MNHNDTIPNSTTTIIPTRGSSAMDLSGADSILLNPKDSPEEKVLPSLVSLPPLPSLDQPSCAAQLPPIVGVGALEVQGFEGKHMRIFTPPTRASGGATATATATAAAAINGSNSSLDINSVSNVELHSISSQKFLSKYFHLPIVEAAKELGMCTTMLKKLCRRCGISRWPYRKIHSVDRILSSLREYIDSQDGDEGLKEEMKHDIADLKEYRANLVADPERWLSYKIGNDFSCLPTKRLRQHVDGTPIAAEASANSNATVPAPMLSQQQQQQQQQQPLPSLPLLTNADITERKLPQTQLDEMPLPKKVRVAIETLSQLGNAHADRQQQPQEQQQLSSQEFTLPPLRFLSD